MSMCRVFSCVGGRGCLLWPVCSLGKTQLDFALLQFVLLRPNLPVTQGISWLPTFAFQSPKMLRKSFLGVGPRRSCRPSNNCSTSPLQHYYYWGIDLDYYHLERFALETNRDHTIVFEIAPKYCISDSFVDYVGYSIFSNVFLPAVVDIMVIWAKFTHSSPF